MNLANKILCPVCNGNTILVNRLSVNDIISSLELYIKKEIPNNLKIQEYHLYKCNICYLIFSQPQQIGSRSFYKFITSQKSYYTSFRWEYFKVSDKLKNAGKGNLLDIGCGDGAFFDILKGQAEELDMFGLEPTKESATKCQNKGYKVYNTTLDNLPKDIPLFDFITLFHVLEHISNPKEFVLEVMNLLKTNGILYISTPLSPMSFESGWFDILNHPPHHLTRWNLSAYKQLAKELNCDIKVYTESNVSLFRQILNSFKLSTLGPSKTISTKKLLFKMALRPFTALRHVYYMLIREKINGKRAGDVILVSLSKKNESE